MNDGEALADAGTDTGIDPNTPPDNGGVSSSGAPDGGEPPASDPSPAGDAKQVAPEDWRARMSGGDEKLLGFLARIPSEKAAIERLKRYEDDIKAGKYRKPLGDDPSDDELAAWRKELGVPDAAEGYMQSLPEGMVVGDDDKPYVDQFLAAMHAQNAPPQVVNAALDAYYKVVQEQEQEQAESDHAADQQCVDALREEWGADFRRNQNILKAHLETLPQEVADAFRGGRGPDGVPLSMNPAFLRWLTADAMERNPVSVVVPGAGANQASAIADRKAEIERVMASDRRRYNADEKMQDEYRRLIEAENKLKA